MKKKFAASIISAAASVSAASVYAMSAFAEDAAATDTAASGSTAGPLLTFILPLGLMFVLLYFMAIKPQKKREKEQKEMQDSLRVGDEIVTTGGIIGMVARIADDNIVIETGGERNKIRIKKWAIAENISAAERMKETSGKKSALATSGVSDEPEKKSKKKKSKEESEDKE